jgi:uncharacterized protein with HEPN domain
MQPNKLLKYLLDIDAIIHEIELVKGKYPGFQEFNDDFMARRTIERHLEIIGEAINHIRKLDDNISISGITQIVNLRNFIIHAYDAVDTGILWGIIQKDIPVLKREIDALMR